MLNNGNLLMEGLVKGEVGSVFDIALLVFEKKALTGSREVNL